MGVITRRQFLSSSSAIAGSVLLASTVPLRRAAAQGGKFGGVFKAATETPVPSLDAMSNVSAATREAGWFVFESLVTYSEDYKIVPLLAERWEVSRDGKTYTFPLRRGVKFHNGREMVADDVVASTARFLKVTPKRSQFELLESVDRKDAYSVVFHLKAPSLAFLDAMANPVGFMAVMPKEMVEGKEANRIPNEEIVGTGPYRLAEWKPDRVFRVRRFDAYNSLPGPRSGQAGGKIAYLDEVQLIPVPEAGARVAGLETGEYDYAKAVPTTEYERLKGIHEVTPHVIKPASWTVLMFNCATKPSSNLKFRQAVQAALDCEAIAQAVTNGIKDFYRVQPSIFFSESPWVNDAAAKLYNQKNPDKARQLLKAAGYAGELIVLVTNRNYTTHFKSVVAAAEQLKAIGMNTRVDVLDWPGQRARWKEKAGWHISTTGYVSQALFAPDSFAAIYASQATSDERAGYANPEMDKWFDRAARAMKEAERKEAFAQIQRIFHEDVAGVKVADFFNLEAIRSNVKGFAPWYNNTRFWSIWRA